MDLSELRVESATASDDLPVRGLLTAAGLPLEGLSDQFPSAYVVAHHRGVIVGVAGLEAYGQVGLLRSVAVADSMRSRGLGRRLVENRLARAREGGLKSVFLLTSTAPDYFERLGFSRADRAGAPRSSPGRRSSLTPARRRRHAWFSGSELFLRPFRGCPVFENRRSR